MIEKTIEIFDSKIILLTKIKPYPPNFNKTPAKIIDPATGASTCALGSHIWKKKIGNLIKNANIINIDGNSVYLIKLNSVNWIDTEPVKFKFNKIINNKGKDPNNV